MVRRFHEDIATCSDNAFLSNKSYHNACNTRIHENIAACSEAGVEQCALWGWPGYAHYTAYNGVGAEKAERVETAEKFRQAGVLVEFHAHNSYG